MYAMFYRYHFGPGSSRVEFLVIEKDYPSGTEEAEAEAWKRVTGNISDQDLPTLERVFSLPRESRYAFEDRLAAMIRAAE